MMIAGNAPSTVVISDTEMSRSKFPQMSSRTGQSELLRVDEVLDKAAENANEPKTASNKAVIWKGHGNVNLWGARERIGWITLMLMMMMMLMHTHTHARTHTHTLT